MSSFDPSSPDGTNRSLQIAVSDDGTPRMNHTYTIDARCGVAVRVGAGQQLVVINVNRSGFSGGSKSRKDWSHGKGQ
jgi:hypothetical protein